MKFLSAIALLAATASATAIKPRQRGVIWSSYALTMASNFEAPYSNHSITAQDGQVGFYGVDPENPLYLDVTESWNENGELTREISLSGIESAEGEVHLALGGEQGDSLRRLIVAAGGDEAAELTLENVEDESGVVEIVSGLEGEWVAENVGGDNYALRWWTGEGFITAINIPVKLYGRLAAQS